MKEEGLPHFEVVNAEGDKEDEVTEGKATGEEGETDEDTEEEQPEKKKVMSKDPLRWFGLLTPQPLRTAQASSVEAVSTVIPRLVTLNQEMSQLEIEVRRARKKRSKAEAAAGKDATATSPGIKAA